MSVTYIVLRYIRHITPFNIESDLGRNNLKDRFVWQINAAQGGECYIKSKLILLWKHWRFSFE